MEKRIMTLLAVLFLFVGGAMAQMKVNGTVVSQDDGQPVIGASVMVVGTSVGTVTNAQGQFSLTCPAGKNMLRITYVGMEPLEVSARPNMRILLTSDQKALDEVIVVAYGTAKKSAFTGSAAVLSTEDLQKHTVTSITEALAGNVPGLQIRGSSGQPGSGGGSINIRGLSSLYSTTDPLVIVDGAPYPASLSNIPASDIESVSVLKDAASAALYGARGASGVIIITTKKGKSQEAKITADVKWGANSRAIQDYDVITNPAEFYEVFYKQHFNNYYYGQNYSLADANKAANTMMMNQLGYNVYTLPEGQNLIGTNGKLNPNAKLGRAYQWNGETYYMQPDDWTDAAYKTALRQEYNVNVNAANDRGSFYASFGYLNEDGVIEYSGYRRTSARLKADYQLKPWMKMAANVSYVHSDQSSNPNMSTDWGSTNLMYYTTYIAPIYPIYVRTLDANGNPTIRTDANGNPQYDYGVPATNYGVGRAFLQTGNPLGSNRYNETVNQGNQLNGNFSVDIQLTPWLKFNNTSTVNLGQTSASFYDNALYGPKVGVNGELSKYQVNTLRQNHVQTLNFMKEFSKNELTLLLGHEYWDQKTRYIDGTAQGGFTSAVKELNLFAKKTNTHSYTTEYNVEGYFGSAQYNYDDKYFASASYRRDASSRFDKDHRWGNFWSVGAAWLINKERFFENLGLSWVDQLKVKASIGQQGNDNTANFAFIDTYSLTAASETAMSPSFRMLGNDQITWETLTNTNIGLEFSLLKGRLTGNFDWYYRKTTDLLFWLSIPESAGTRGYYGNVGDIRNAGIELNLTGTIIKTRDLQWDLMFNISHNSGKILKLPESKTAANGGFYEAPFWYTEGGVLNNYMNYAYAGVNEKGEALYYYDKSLTNKLDENGKPFMDSDGKPLNNTFESETAEDGTVSWSGTNIIAKPGASKDGTTTEIGEASRYTSGSTLPKAYGGFGTSLRLFGFDISATFDFQLGGKIYDYGYAKLMTPGTSNSDAGYNYHKDVLKAWTPENTNSDIPRWQYGDQYAAYGSDRFLTSAKYLNFQSFNVGYTLPKNFTKKFQVENIRVYASGENLVFWSARKGLDPRYAFSETASTNVYSPIRTISGGIQLTF